MRLTALCLLGVGLWSGAASADPVDTNAARKMLFSPRGVEMAVQPDTGLDAGQTATLEAILKQMSAAGLSGYYGAVAVSPAFFDMMASDPGAATLSGLFQVAEKYHSAETAAGVALQACQKARKSGQAPCAVAAHVLPKRWKPQPLQLSVDATAAFAEYRKGKGPKAFAISQASGAYAFAKGEGAQASALADCAARSNAKGGGECALVIAD
jgi:hypothetical protein